MIKRQSKPNHSCDDPVFLRTKREAFYILVAWTVGMIWTVGYCFVTGYNVPSEKIKATMGIPNWVFFGVLVPWIIITIFSIWFSLFYIADDDSGKTDE
ncbi:MAG: DUF997 family protein [Gammaproteobacteria bacterium]|nr:DUF997 family protein [Gammaproteobacteria bacterium]